MFDPNTASQAQLEAKKHRYDVAYAEGEPLVSDTVYDRLVRIMRKRFPKSKSLVDVGADLEIKGVKKEKLPMVIGSLDLLRPKDVGPWMKRMNAHNPEGRYLIEPKFDGASLTLRYIDTKLDKAWSRGKVVEGSSMGFDVTASARHTQGVLGRLRDAGNAIDIDGEYLVRGELIMHKSIFNEHYKGKINPKTKKPYSNARNLVAGFVNRAKPDADRTYLNRCTFIALQLYRKDKKGVWRRPGDAHREWVYLTLMGFTTALNPVRYSAGHTKIYNMVKKGHEGLRQVLPVHEIGGAIGEIAYADAPLSEAEVVERMQAIFKTIDIRCDGIVIQPLNNIFWQKTGEQLKKHPAFVQAIKLEAGDQDAFDGHVGHIEWNVSKRGLLKPRLMLKIPLMMEGVEVSHATCNNAEYVRKWGLRSGRPIQMVRSGDVIPHIVRVHALGKWVSLKFKKRTAKSSRATGMVINEEIVDGPGIVDSKIDAALPKKCPECSGKIHWTKTHTDLVCDNEECPARHERNVLSFFRHLKVDDVAKATVADLMNAGMDTVAKIFKGATPQRLMKLERYQASKANKVSAAIAGAMKEVPLAQVMHASGIFLDENTSMGSTRLQNIIDCVGEGAVARGTATEIRAKLAKLHGIGAVGIELFLESLTEWRQFYGEIKAYHSTPKGPKTLKGVVACWTGFRSPEQEKFLTQRGGRVSGSVSKAVNVLFAASTGSGKAKKADTLGIPVVPEDQAWAWLKDRS